MSDKSKIQWTDASWNPIVGCSKISPGCQNCYAEKMAQRLAYMGNNNYRCVVNHIVEDLSGENVVNTPDEWWDGWHGTTHFVESALSKPLHWRKGRKIFVCSMGDLFHESVPFEWIDKVFAVMALCPQHTFQVLTKRAERMKEYFEDNQTNGILNGISELQPGMKKAQLEFSNNVMYDLDEGISELQLPNVWLGVTAENQEMADSRIPLLLQTPAAKRFVSVEPMLGAVDLMRDIGGTLWIGGQRGCGGRHKHGRRHEDGSRGDSPHHHHDNRCNTGLDWVIVGAESGAGMRKCKWEWPDSIVHQCKDAGVPCFVKQIHEIDSLKLIKSPAGWPRQFPA